MVTTVLETEKRLSHSLLWNLQNQAYTTFGIKAWSHYGVPSYITSNTYTVRSYVQVVLGFLRDSLPHLNLEHPIYIFDLGAGTGRFAYLFLKELLRFMSQGSLSPIKICYVMTDIASSNIEFWQQHPYLKPYFDKGILECAFYNYEQHDPIRLIHRNQVLTKKAMANPLILIGNYFFDTIPQDLFRVKNGRLEEGRVTLEVASEKEVIDPLDPNLINRLNSKYSYHPIEDASSYYSNPHLNAILEDYRQKFDGCSFLFPIGAYHVLDTFIKLSGSRLMLLAGDQGVCTEAQVRHWGEPRLALHGSFSIAVSYHAIASYFHHLKGHGFLTTLSDPAFVVMAGVLEKNKKIVFAEMAMAFETFIDSFEPSDYWKLVSLTEEQWKDPPLEQILLLLKLGRWDAMSLNAFIPRIRTILPKATTNQKQQLEKIIDQVWDQFYPVTSYEGSFVMNLGIVLSEMMLYSKALTYFDRAIELEGPSSAALSNMATCYKHLGNEKAALECLEKASKIKTSPTP